jgi:serine/threonine protein kinase
VQLSKSYQLIRKLAAGGMAEVFLARTDGPKGFSKTLVVKRILQHLAEDAQFVDMFLNEARLVAQLSHPNVVQIFDFGEFKGSYHIVMEFIDGPNLRTLWRQAGRLGEQLPPALCAKIISYACEGLAYAHDFVSPDTGKPLGLIHRDVSGDNILVSRNGAVKVVDFGIAKVLGQTQHTKTGTVRGKIPYMPPEQLQAKPLDRRVDVFALGMVLYELLSGKRPFDATGEMEMMHAILHEPPKPIRQRRPEVPEALEQVLQRALAKKPSDRYPSCRHLRADLERFILSAGEPVGTYEVAKLVEHLFPREPDAQAAQTITDVNRPRTPPTPPRASSASKREPEATPPKQRVPSAGKRGARPASQGLPAEEAASMAAAAPPRLLPVAAPAPGSFGGLTTRPMSELVEAASGLDPDSDSSTLSLSVGLRRILIVAAAVGLVLTVSAGAVLWGKRSQLLGKGQVAQPELVQPPAKPPAGGAAQPVHVPRPQPPSEAPAPQALQQPPTPEGAPEAPSSAGSAPAAEPPPSTEHPPEKAARASVVIEASPPAQIKVNGRRAGFSPVYLRNLEPGPARVKVYDSIRGFSKEQIFLLKPGDNGVKRITVGIGTLEFRLPPSTTVILDGRNLGRTPLAPLSLYEGMYALRLENSELDKSLSVPVEIEAGKTRVLDLNLRKR